MFDTLDKTLLQLTATCLLACAVIGPLAYLNDLRDLNARVRAAVPGCHNGRWKCSAHWEHAQAVVDTVALHPVIAAKESDYVTLLAEETRGH